MIQRAVEESPPGFGSLGLSPAMLRALKRIGYLKPIPHPGGVDPRGPRRSRRHRPGQDGHRQDGRVRHPADRDARGARQGAPGDHPGPHPRARPADRRRAPAAGRTARTSRSAASTAASRSSASSGPCSAASTSSSARRAASSTIIERRTLYLGDIFHVVLDEADRMLDIGFRPDIERILRQGAQPASDVAAVGDHQPRHPQARPARTCTSRSR